MVAMRAFGACGLFLLGRGQLARVDDAAGLLQTSAQPSESVSLADAIGSMLTAMSAAMDRTVIMLDITGEKVVRKPKGPRGVRFSRNISHIEPGSDMIMELSAKQGSWADDDPEAFSCKDHDKHGGNHCRFLYGSNLQLKVAAKIGRPVKEGSKIIIDIPRPHAAKGSMGAILINRIKPMHVECPACTASENCTASYMEHHFTIKIPRCPIPAGETTFVDKVFPLPNVPGLSGVEGHTVINMLALREDGSTLGDVSMKMGMGSLETADGPAGAAAGASEQQGQEEEDRGHKHKHHHR